MPVGEHQFPQLIGGEAGEGRRPADVRCALGAGEEPHRVNERILAGRRGGRAREHGRRPPGRVVYQEIQIPDI
ncbi:MAG: hypothetical protein ACREOE_15235, partial [Gemmatimonadales bacterium]